MSARLIADYGDQAYHKAVEFTVIAVHTGDDQGAKQATEAAKELMRQGYHKHAKKVPEVSG